MSFKRELSCTCTRVCVLSAVLWPSYWTFQLCALSQLMLARVCVPAVHLNWATPLAWARELMNYSTNQQPSGSKKFLGLVFYGWCVKIAFALPSRSQPVYGQYGFWIWILFSYFFWIFVSFSCVCFSYSYWSEIFSLYEGESYCSCFSKLSHPERLTQDSTVCNNCTGWLCSEKWQGIASFKYNNTVFSALISCMIHVVR